MIPVAEVTAAYLALLRETWPHVGDGGPPPLPDPGETGVLPPWAWLEPDARPGPGPKMGGGEPETTVALSVFTAAVDGDGAEARFARAQAESLADRLRAVMIDDPMPSGGTWRVSGRLLISTVSEPEAGGWVTRQDFRLYVAALHP